MERVTVSKYEYYESLTRGKKPVANKYIFVYWKEHQRRRPPTYDLRG